jgi:uroporphyrinogen decarboxylase
MNHRERAIAALECRVPDMVPHFELEYQLSEETHGKKMYFGHEFETLLRKGITKAEFDYALEECANAMAEIFTELEWSIIPMPSIDERIITTLSGHLHRLLGDSVLLSAHGDGTFAIPDGNEMYEFAYRIADDPDGVHEEARRLAREAMERNRKLFDAGVECFHLCADYCYNSGPFLSPAMFGEFIAPYLAEVIDGIRKMGGYAIKHTDGNIMPILDQLIECRPHALHSLDPMAGVDIAEVKKIAAASGVAICGNVNCAALQTGTDEEIRQSALYAMRHGKPGGGYIFCSSNTIFKGIEYEKYRIMLDVWKEHRYYGDSCEGGSR